MFSILDVNNLYGWEMRKQMPTYGFRCEKKVDDFIPEKITTCE